MVLEMTIGAAGTLKGPDDPRRRHCENADHGLRPEPEYGRRETPAFGAAVIRDRQSSGEPKSLLPKTIAGPVDILVHSLRYGEISPTLDYR
jgi:hypothetical protein